MSGQFVVLRNGRDTFYTEEELRRDAERGLIRRGDLVYHPILARWFYAREVEEIRDQVEQAESLGRPLPAPVPAEPNGDAMAGFVLGVLGHVPLVGLFACLFGLYFSGRGLKRAAQLENRGHSLAVAGMALSIVFLVPATAWAALCLSGLMGS